MADSDSSTAGAHATAASDRRLFLRFAIPSLLGVLAFLTPMFEDGKITIGLAIMSNALAALMEGWLGPIAGIVLAGSALLSIYATTTRARRAGCSRPCSISARRSCWCASWARYSLR